MAIPRPSRRATSHYNAFQTGCLPSHDSPPAYALAAKQRPPPAIPTRHVLPPYRSNVSYSAPLLLYLETASPLHPATTPISSSEWREVHISVIGTLLSFHRTTRDPAVPGRLLRSYTLQHAEVGLASDREHTLLIPQTRLAHLIPQAARQRAWHKDPDLFKSQPQTLFRLRVETDQILLASDSETRVFDAINAISAGIDIAPAIDERSIPRQCTVPRRRRARVDRRDVSGPALLAEQERILAEMYPGFAQERGAEQVSESTSTATTEDETADLTLTRMRSPEEDDVDFSMMTEDSDPSLSPRPPISRQTTASSTASASSLVYATSPSNFTPSGKWQPPHPRTAAQTERYIRRCMPVLLADAVRASDVLICASKRVKIDWRQEGVVEWELKPPSYRHHVPAVSAAVVETIVEAPETLSSADVSDEPTTPHSAAAEIEAAQTGMAGLELSETKSNSTSKPTSLALRLLRREQPSEETKKPPRAKISGTEVHGAVFCF